MSELMMTNTLAYEPSLRDWCEVIGWDFVDLGQRLAPPVTNAAISRWARGLRPLPEEYARQMAEQLKLSEDQIRHAIAEGARRHAQRQQFLAQTAPSSKPAAAKRPRKTSVA